MKITIELIIEERHGDPLLKGPDPLTKVFPEVGKDVVDGIRRMTASEIQEIKRKEIERYDAELHARHFRRMTENNLFDQFDCPVCYKLDCPEFAQLKKN